MTRRGRLAGPTPTPRCAAAYAAPARPAAGDAPRRAPVRAPASPAPGAGSPTSAPGGTTPWAHWQEPAPSSGQAGRFLPGAQQLELLRRLNLVGRPSAELAERVLAASAPGRGLPDLGLDGVAAARRASARRPSTPSRLAPDELVRVATALLAEDVVAAGDPDQPRRRQPAAPPLPAARRPRARPTDPRGAHRRAAAPRAVPRRPSSCSGPSLDRMLAHVWTARSLGAGVPAVARTSSPPSVRRPPCRRRIDLADRGPDLGRPGGQPAGSTW